MLGIFEKPSTLQLAYDKGALSKEIYLIPMHQRYTQLSALYVPRENSNSSPRKSILQVCFEKFHNSNPTNIVQLYLDKQYGVTSTVTAPSINPTGIELLTVLASLPAHDFASAMQLKINFRLQSGDQNYLGEISLLEYFCLLDYKDTDHIKLNNNEYFNLKKCSIRAWHAILFRAVPNENILSYHKINLLKQLFPVHEITPYAWERYDTYHKVLLSLLLAWNSSITSGVEQEIKSFLVVAKKYRSYTDSLFDPCHLKVAINLLEKMMISKHDVDHDRFMNCPKSVMREWCFAIKLEASKIPRHRMILSQGVTVLLDAIDHINSLIQQISEDEIDYSVWILGFRRIIKLMPRYTILQQEYCFAEIKNLIELINLNPVKALERYLMPLVQVINDTLEVKYRQKPILSCDSSDDEIANVLKPKGPVEIIDLLSENNIATPVYNNLQLSKGNYIREIVVPRLPTTHQAHALYLILSRNAVIKDGKFHDLEGYLARFTKAICKKALSMSEIFFEKNSLLLLYARHQKDDFLRIYRIYQKFFTPEELKELLEQRNTNNLSVLDEILCADWRIFYDVREWYRGDVDRLRRFLEAGYDEGTSSLQRLTRVKDPSAVNSTRINLSPLYADDKKLWTTLMRKDAQGQTCLDRAVKNGNLEIWLTFAYWFASTPNVNSSVLGCLADCRSEEFATTIINNNEKKITEIYERALHENPNQVLPILKRAVENKSVLVSNTKLLENFFMLIIVFKCAGKIGADQNETLGFIIKVIRETHNLSSQNVNVRSQSFDPILLNILEQLITPGTNAFQEEDRKGFPTETLTSDWLQRVNISVASINRIFHSQINRLHEPSLSTFLYLEKVLSLIDDNVNKPEHMQFDTVTKLIILRRFVRALPLRAYLSSNSRIHPDWNRLAPLLYLSPDDVTLHLMKPRLSHFLNTLLTNQEEFHRNEYLKISNDSTASPRHITIKWINAEIEKYFVTVLEPLADDASNKKILSVLNTPVFDSKGDKFPLINFLMHSNCQAGANLIDLHLRFASMLEPDASKKIIDIDWIVALLTCTGTLSNEKLHQKLVELINFYSERTHQGILLCAIKYAKFKISILDHALMNDALWDCVVNVYAGQIPHLQTDLEKPEYKNGKTSIKIESCLDAPDKLQRIFNLYNDDLSRLREFAVKHFFNKTNLSIIGKNSVVLTMLVKLFEGGRAPGLFTQDEDGNTLFHHAVNSGESTVIPNLLTVILNLDLDPENLKKQLTTKNHQGTTPLLLIAKLYQGFRTMEILTNSIPPYIRKDIMEELFQVDGFACLALVYCFAALASNETPSDNTKILIDELIPLIKNMKKNGGLTTLNVEPFIVAIEKLLAPETVVNIFEENRDDLPNEKICEQWVKKIISCLKTYFNPLDDHVRQGHSDPHQDAFHFVTWVCRGLEYSEAPYATKLLILRKAARLHQYELNNLNEGQRLLFKLIMMQPEIAVRHDWSQELLTDRSLIIQHPVGPTWDFFAEKKGDIEQSEDNKHENKKWKGKEKLHAFDFLGLKKPKTETDNTDDVSDSDDDAKTKKLDAPATNSSEKNDTIFRLYSEL